MAESVVSQVLSQLTNLLVQEAAFLRGTRDQVEWVKRELKRMEGFLRDAESRRRKGDARVENWIREIRDVAYEVEDIIDTVKFMAERQRQGRGFMGSLSRYSHKPYELTTLHKIGSEIGKIKEKIRDISESRASYGIANLDESGSGVLERNSDWDDSLRALRNFPPRLHDDTDVIGLEDDKAKLVKLLVDPGNKNRSVISIVGMGGLGKSTLARKVHNDPAIRKHFDTFAWVSVSQNHRVIELLQGIAEKAMGITKKEATSAGIITLEDLKQMGEEEGRVMLHDFLGDKKYLVVMDDVWTVNVWRQMDRVFPNGNNGSRILLTSRNIEVARHAEPWIPPYELQLLNDARSLELFCGKAFPPNQAIPTELEELAQKLVKRCGGLPLALVVLGGLLSRKDASYDAWAKVAQSMNWESSGEGQECLGIVGLSYNDLPYQLKPCFLYITAFPEDTVIYVSKLVRLWIAEGFVVQEQRRTMEDTARDWLDELVQRCMIQVVERSWAHGWVKEIRIHDMLRDFGLSEARKDDFLQVCSSSDVAVSHRISSHRAAFHNRMIDEAAVSSPHLRTLLGFHLVSTNYTAGFILKGLNLLRVLDLEGAKDLTELPEQIGNMIHLRYLGLRETGLKRLPSSIARLLNLQTLDVALTEILWLPKKFWGIRTLRHVYINIYMLLSVRMIGDHKDMQTMQIGPCVRNVIHFFSLPRIRFFKNWVVAPGFTKEAISKTRERMLEKSFGEALEKMDSLASLYVGPLDHGVPADVFFARAPNLHRLHSLALFERLLLKQQQQLPDSSQFPPNLAQLVLSMSELEQDPMPVLEKLPNLRSLELYRDAYMGKIISCSSPGGFPRLQQLMLTALPSFEEWRVEVGAMPSLNHLTIRMCARLEMLPEGLQHVTTLKELRLDEMPRKFNDRVRNEDEYKVRRIPSIIFENECDGT